MESAAEVPAGVSWNCEIKNTPYFGVFANGGSCWAVGNFVPDIFGRHLGITKTSFSYSLGSYEKRTS